MGIRAWTWALALAVAALGAAACEQNAGQRQGARSYNQRTDAPPPDIGPAGNNVGAEPRDMPGKGRGGADPRGK